MKRKILATWITGLVLITSVNLVFAWGPQGHRLVAEIAQQRLAEDALQVLRDEFNINRLSDVANWADHIKRKRKVTRPWHYTNIPEGKTTYVRQRDCPDNNCVTEKINEFANQLTDPSIRGRKRKEALMFLVHFVGDVHQPVHLGNRKDRGGNKITVRFQGEETNLHAVWDHDLIHMENQSLIEYASGLAGKVPTRQASERKNADVVKWSNESRVLALEKAYLLKLDKQGELSTEYIREGRRVVRKRLQQAGVRLAALLNRLLIR